LYGPTDAAITARRAVAAGDGVLPAAVREDVLLLVTELVTNAVRHARIGPDRPVRVDVRRSVGSVRVEVADRGAGFTQVATPCRPRDEPGGSGVFLVEQISHRWGVDATAPGTCVWFEIDFER
jgi:anti-sigma regulatory factor (Ser/Thr protein kinase)